MKFSIRTLLISLTVVAICAGWFASSYRNQRLRAINRFERSVAYDKPVNVGLLVNAIGEDAARKRLIAGAELNSNITFDGRIRLAQIIPPNDGHGFSLGFNLAGIGGTNGGNFWQLPPGGRISSLEFDGDTLRITLYGDVQHGSSRCVIPIDSPETYELNWPAGSPDPPRNNLSAMIQKRHAKKLPSDGG